MQEEEEVVEAGAQTMRKGVTEKKNGAMIQ